MGQVDLHHIAKLRLSLCNRKIVCQVLLNGFSGRHFRLPVFGLDTENLFKEIFSSLLPGNKISRGDVYIVLRIA